MADGDGVPRMISTTRDLVYEDGADPEVETRGRETGELPRVLHP